MSKINEAQERVNEARTALRAAEDDMVDVVLDEIALNIEEISRGVRATVNLVQKLPPQSSLDYSTAKRESAKELEEINRNLDKIRKKLHSLRKDGDHE